jgi:hypothetical protein
MVHNFSFRGVLHKMKAAFIAVALALLTFADCSTGGGQTWLLKGDRKLGIDITLAEDGSFENAIAKLQSLGAEVIPVTFYWDDIEVAPGVFSSDTSYFDIINTFYKSAGFRIALVLCPIDTYSSRVPFDLSICLSRRLRPSGRSIEISSHLSSRTSKHCGRM